MTSANILPTFGPAPPNIRRVPVPRELQPQGPQQVEGPIAARAATQGDRQPTAEKAPISERSEPAREPFPLPENLAGAAAVTVQVAESGAPDQRLNGAVPRVLPSGTSNNINLSDDAQAQEGASLSNELTEEEQAYVRELQAIDREVRAHEAAHANTGGGFAGRPTYEYVTGPDGQRYAVSGRVQIDVSAVEGDPEATIRKLETVRRAALAPARPSGQDRAVAAQAAASIRQAEAELSARRNEEAEELLSGESNENEDRPFDLSSRIANDEASAKSVSVVSASSRLEESTQPLNVRNQIADRAFERAGLLSNDEQNGGTSTQAEQQFNLIA